MTSPRIRLLPPLLLALAAPAAARAADVPLPPPPAGMALQDTSPSRGYSVGLLAGFLAQGDVASASLQVDVGRELTVEKLKRVRLELHVPVRFARPEWDGAITQTVINPYTGVPASETVGSTKDTVWLFEAIPSGRLVVPVVKGFALHAEVGVGLAVTAETHVEDQMFVGKTTKRSLVVAPSIQAALGLTYQLSERLDAVFQPVAFGRRAKADASTFSALWGLSYRL